jgi:anti-anti-sigma regulatory factor
MTDLILVAIDNPYVHVRINGRGTFQNAPDLKSFFESLDPSSPLHIILDLQSCSYLDSTFLGTLTGIALKLKQQHHPSLTIINPSERNLELICNLCLDKLFNIVTTTSSPITANKPLEPLSHNSCLDKTTTSASMLEAHENLIQWHSPNAEKFQDVLHYLRTRQASRPTT